jgi:hypothetical protein
MPRTSKWNNGLPHTITTPTFSSPAGGTILTAGVATTFSTSSYSIAPTNTLLTHVSTDWQLSLSADFSSISAESLADTSNKTSWTVTIPAGGSPVYVRVRYTNQNCRKKRLRINILRCISKCYIQHIRKLCYTQTIQTQ